MVKEKPFGGANTFIFLAELGNNQLKRISGDRKPQQRKIYAVTGLAHNSGGNQRGHVVWLPGS